MGWRCCQEPHRAIHQSPSSLWMRIISPETPPTTPYTPDTQQPLGASTWYILKSRGAELSLMCQHTRGLCGHQPRNKDPPSWCRARHHPPAPHQLRAESHCLLWFPGHLGHSKGSGPYRVPWRSPGAPASHSAVRDETTATLHYTEPKT